MSSLRRLSERGGQALLQLACIPLFIKFMGIEAYGLIGFYLVLQAMLQVLDLGLSPTMNARWHDIRCFPKSSTEARDLVRTLEIGYWFIGLLIGGGILMASPWLAVHWIKASTIPVRNVMQAVMLMGVLTVFQWPVSFYQGGLMGLRRQGLVNALKIGAGTLNNVGGVLILWMVSPTIQALLAWQAGISAVWVISFGSSHVAEPTYFQPGRPIRPRCGTQCAAFRSWNGGNRHRWPSAHAGRQATSQQII